MDWIKVSEKKTGYKDFTTEEHSDFILGINVVMRYSHKYSMNYRHFGCFLDKPLILETIYLN